MVTRHKPSCGFKDVIIGVGVVGEQDSTWSAKKPRLEQSQTKAEPETESETTEVGTVGNGSSSGGIGEK